MGARVTGGRTVPRFGVALALITLAALAVRLWYALHVMGDHRFAGDGAEFHYLALKLAETNAYLEPFPLRETSGLLQPGLDLSQVFARGGPDIPTAEKPPLYPAYLAAWAKLGLSSMRFNLVASSLLGTGTVVAAGLIGRRVAGARTGLVAAALAAVYLDLVLLDGSLRSESLYVLAVALALLAAYRMTERPSWPRAAWLGVAIAAAALTRSEGLVLIALLAASAAWLAGGTRRERLRLLAIACAGCALVVTPWLARNWIVFDRPTPISTNQGGLLAGANCERAYYGKFLGTWGCFPRWPSSWGRNESVISGRLQARALDYAGDHAGRIPAVAGVRVLRTWELWDPREFASFEAVIADRNPGLSRKAQVLFWVVAAFAVAGVVMLRRRRHPLRLLAAPLLLVSVVSAATYGSTRFRAAAEPALVVLAAVAIEALGGRALESVRRGFARHGVRLVRRRPVA